MLGAHLLYDWAFRIWRALEFGLTNYRGSGILLAARATDSWEGSYGEDVQRRNKLENLQSKALFRRAISVSSVLSLSTGSLGCLGWLLAARPAPSSTIARNRHFASSFTPWTSSRHAARTAPGSPFGTCMVTDGVAVGTTSSRAADQGNCAPRHVTFRADVRLGYRK